MAAIRVTVDGVTTLDVNLDPTHWQQQPPEYLRELVKPEAREHPYNLSVLGEIARAAARNVSTTIEVTTDDCGWNVRTRYVTADALKA